MENERFIPAYGSDYWIYISGVRSLMFWLKAFRFTYYDKVPISKYLFRNSDSRSFGWSNEFNHSSYLQYNGLSQAHVVLSSVSVICDAYTAHYYDC